MQQLRRQLLEGEKKVAVWGTGYIGFSTLVNFAAQGVSCVGTDISEKIVSTINDGKMPVPNMEYWLGFDTKYLVQSGMMTATTDWKRLLSHEFAVHMIAVPTEKGDRPWDGALEDVAQKIAKQPANPNEASLIIIESTLTPKKTDDLVIRILEQNHLQVGNDILVGVAPRRDWFISADKNLRSLPRIIGGTTPETTSLMKEVLGIICEHLIPAPDHRHAEIVKSIENAYRHVEITLANQLSLAYPNLNMTKVLKLVGTKWNVGLYHPSFGTGGYCIPLSSHYVIEGAEKPEYLTLLKDTIATDSDLPVILTDNLVKRGVKNVGILGMAYKGDLKVHVLSPTLRITKRLTERGVKVKINDPYYSAEEIKKLTGAEYFEFPKGLVEFDCVLIVAGHREYRAISESNLKRYLTNCRVIIDNVEEAWRTYNWDTTKLTYCVAGDSCWMKSSD